MRVAKRKWEYGRLTIYYWPGDWNFSWLRGRTCRLLDIGPLSFWWSSV